MITGDYQHTAIAVARGVGMIPQEGQVIIVQAKSEHLSHAQVVSVPSSPRAVPVLPWSLEGSFTRPSTLPALSLKPSPLSPSSSALPLLPTAPSALAHSFKGVFP